MASVDELLIGTVEAAEILGVDRATVGRWAASGELPIIRRLPGPNGAILFDSGVIRRKAQERLLQRNSRKAS